MNRTLLSLTLLAALTGPASAAPAVESTAPAGYQTTRYAVPDPAVQVREWARLFRASDVAGLARALVPPSRWEEARLAYELKQLDPISDHDRAEYADKIEMITAPDAVDLLMFEIEPELEKARVQFPGAMLMAFGAMHVALNSPDSDLTEEQREMLQKVVPGIQTWASTTDFLSSDTMRQALTLVTDAARRAGIDDLDQLKALPLDAALDRASPMLAATKQAVRLYGIDLDAIADSLHVDVLGIDGETARIRATVMLFGAPVWAEHELVLVEGRWYGKHNADHWRIRSVAAAVH